MKPNVRNFAIVTSTVAFATMFSVGWSEQRGVSLTVESAHARIGRPLTPFSVAGVARRQYRRSLYGYGAGPVGAGLFGSAAVAATSPRNYDDYFYYYVPSAGTGYYFSRSYVTPLIARPTLFPRYYGGYPSYYYGW